MYGKAGTDVIAGDGKIKYFSEYEHYSDIKSNPLSANRVGPLRVGAFFDAIECGFVPDVMCYQRIEENKLESRCNTEAQAQERADEIYEDLKQRGFPVERFGEQPVSYVGVQGQFEAGEAEASNIARISQLEHALTELKQKYDAEQELTAKLLIEKAELRSEYIGLLAALKPEYFEVENAAGYKILVKIDAVTVMNQQLHNVQVGNINIGVLTKQSFDALLEAFKSRRAIVG